MSLADVACLCQVPNSDILHIILRYVVDGTGDHVGNLSFFLNILFLGRTVQPCHLCQQRQKDSLGFFQVKFLTTTHNIQDLKNLIRKAFVFTLF